MTGLPFPLKSLLGSADPATDRQRAAAVRMDRACSELRRGRPVALSSGTGWLIVAAVETLSDALFQKLAALGQPLQLLLTGERLHALEGRAGPSEAAEPGGLTLPADLGLARLQQLAAVGSGPADRQGLHAVPASPKAAPAWSAGFAMCKRARLIPALVGLSLPEPAGDALSTSDLLQFDPADAVLALPGPAASLRRVSDARVPLAAEEDCTLVVFRELDGEADHLALIVGQPPADQPVPVRLHSACLTGDLLGSLRCDCGPQLQRAVARLAETGGVLLYLAQEGRATGLANKLRAYRLQDAGLDTLQADRHLGFREDERDFAAAAAMLKALGHTRIQLLTNNPQKIEALRQAGIEVVDRLPLPGEVNSHNERYIRTKQRAGHLGGEG